MKQQEIEKLSIMVYFASKRFEDIGFYPEPKKSVYLSIYLLYVLFIFFIQLMNIQIPYQHHNHNGELSNVLWATDVGTFWFGDDSFLPFWPVMQIFYCIIGLWHDHKMLLRVVFWIIAIKTIDVGSCLNFAITTCSLLINFAFAGLSTD